MILDCLDTSGQHFNNFKQKVIKLIWIWLKTT